MTARSDIEVVRDALAGTLPRHMDPFAAVAAIEIALAKAEQEKDALRAEVERLRAALLEAKRYLDDGALTQYINLGGLSEWLDAALAPIEEESE